MTNDIIQADYEQLDSAAARFGRQVSQNQALESRLRQTMAVLQQGGWVGEAANAFYGEMEGEVLPAMQRLTGALEQAQSTTLKIKQIMKTAEEEAAAPFRGHAAVGNIFSQPGTDNGASDGGSGGQSFSWLGFGGGMAGGIGLLKNIGEINYSDFRAFGRFINATIGNKKGGWVGQMDDLAHFLRKNLGLKALAESDFGKYLGHAADAASFGIGVFEDLDKSYSLDKAIITEGIELGASIGLRMIPVVGTALLVYDVGMFAGHMIAGSMEMAGLHDQAVWMQNTLDKIDIDQYMGERIDEFYDWAAPHVTEVAEDVMQAGVGFINDTQEVAGQSVNGLKNFFGI